ncbi:photosystem reaction center subunit H [Sulfitobacter alexandrii]|uniref:Photosystem reaction center subunit H n=1 Tax=Sulfitobacter alexandrii TaxID=1917485 RepID=A0A1J0WJ50_9RHOB|nr:PRC-barrel domain-containing protein [Sulfitobacter alexandrii]APE44331.1 photosystem reaction center subunit H [Sulfitobacter alexandrii]
MKRFLSTTAVVVALSTGAYAQSNTANMDMNAVEFQQGDFYASDLIGMRVYNSENEVDASQAVADGAETEWDDIGEINDIIVAKDGSVRAVILGVGGFLGIGERDVAISMDDISVLSEDGDMGDRFLVVSTTKEALESLPEFDRDMNDDAMNGDTMEQNAEATAENAEQTAENAAENTEQMAENAAEETEQMAENAAAETEQAAENTEQMAENAAEETEQAAENAAAETEQAAENAAQETEQMADNATNEMTRPNYEVEGYQNAEMAEVEQLTSEEINGSYVYGANDETVGEIDNLMVGDDGKLTGAVINVGGFLGIGEKPVLVEFDKIQVMKNADGSDYRFYIDSTEERLEALPEYED